MKPIKELVIPLGDAENYRARGDRAFFNDVYFRTPYLDSLLEPRKYFLCGDKGTGKTAMAVYLHNNDYKDTKADHIFIRDTEIQTLKALRQANRLSLPDNQLLWETALLLRVARLVEEGDLSNGWIERYALLKAIKSNLERYYEERQNPEIKVDIEILKNKQLASKLALKADDIAEFNVGGEAKAETKSKFTHYRDLLNSVNAGLKKALEKGKFKRRLVVLLDGLDNRHEDTDPRQYAETLSALGRAVWHLNTDFFGNIRDSPYKPKIVLLMRPEIVELIGLSNTSLKMRDNAVELDWVVNDEGRYRDSKLFRLISHILASQQPEPPSVVINEAWDHYFPFKHKTLDSFVAVLRRTYHRPRDVVTQIEFMRGLTGNEERFTDDDYSLPEVERKFSEYLLAEIRNGLEFSLQKPELDLIPLFFKSFKGSRKFSYAEYRAFYRDFVADCQRRGKKVAGTVFENADALLQVLFANSFIAYIERTEDRSYVRWFFRERTIGDPAPQVSFDATYVVHDGLAKALDLGARKTAQNQAKSKPGRRRGGSRKA